MSIASPAATQRTTSSTERSNSSKALRNHRVAEIVGAWSLAGPALFFLTVLFFLPVFAVFGIALTDWQFGARTLSFVGFSNFVEIFGDRGFRASLTNTLVYVAIVVPGTIILGLFIALLIESGKSFRAFYRAVHFLPYMATLTAMAIAWEALLHPTIGLVNQMLGALGLPAANWLRDENTVLPVLAVIGIWQNLGFAMVLFLAGLKSIPQELYDAADVDGADMWLDRLRTVTLPMLGPVFMFVFIVVALKAFQTFDTVQVLTQGGPGNASELLLFTLYRESFQYLRTGYGASIAVIFLFIVVALTLFQTRIIDRKVHYQ
jgi:multiple sugar transport system permease protein